MKYKVGDKVEVRTWKDMEKEFGLTKNGSINCDYCFNQMMKKYCGKIVTIKSVYGYCYSVSEDDGCWNWCDDMFEKKINKPLNKFFFKKDRTIYYDKDGKKTVVKCCEDDIYSKKMGVLFAIAKANGYTWKDIEKICEEPSPKNDWNKFGNSWVEVGATYIVREPFTSLCVDWDKGEKVICTGKGLGHLLVKSLKIGINFYIDEEDFKRHMVKVAK